MCYCNPQKPRVSDVTISFIVIFLTVDVAQSTEHSPHSFNSLSGRQTQDTEEDMRKHEPCKNFGNFTVSGGWKTFMVGKERTIWVLKNQCLVTLTTYQKHVKNFRKNYGTYHLPTKWDFLGVRQITQNVNKKSVSPVSEWYMNRLWSLCNTQSQSSSEDFLSVCYVLSVVPRAPWLGLVQDGFFGDELEVEPWRMVGFRKKKKQGFPWCKGENFSAGGRVCTFGWGTNRRMNKFNVKQIVFILCVVYKSVLCSL